MEEEKEMKADQIIITCRSKTDADRLKSFLIDLENQKIRIISSVNYDLVRKNDVKVLYERV